MFFINASLRRRPETMNQLPCHQIDNDNLSVPKNTPGREEIVVITDNLTIFTNWK